MSVEVGNFALKSDGTVWIWGSNTYGQIGYGSKDEKAKSHTAPC
ncbi:RCC1-like domain-containing protein [Paenibacillus sinopodophylli]